MTSIQTNTYMDCYDCVQAFTEGSGCEIALQGKWYANHMPEECIGMMHPGQDINCREWILDYCHNSLFPTPTPALFSRFNPTNVPTSQHTSVLSSNSGTGTYPSGLSFLQILVIVDENLA